jgi:hypothetical protein
MPLIEKLIVSMRELICDTLRAEKRVVNENIRYK